MTQTRGWPYTDRPPTDGKRGSRRGAKLALAERVDILSQVPLFGGLPKKHLREIARVASVRDFYDGADVVREGHKAANCFVIVEGSAAVTKNGKEVAVLGPGDVIGEMAIFDDVPRTATVVAQGELTALHLSRSELLEFLGNHPQVALKLLEVMAQRLRTTTESATSL